MELEMESGLYDRSGLRARLTADLPPGNLSLAIAEAIVLIIGLIRTTPMEAADMVDMVLMCEVV